MVIGLTLGKYAPLTKGHTFVFDEALKQCDKLIVLVYDAPSTIDIPLRDRAVWIRKLYHGKPVVVIEGHGSPEVTGDTNGIRNLQEQYVNHVLRGQRIDKFFSSEFYGKHMSESLGAENVLIDPKREIITISATTLRSNPLKYRLYTYPIVYSDLITNVCLVGAPSTGKTTLCKQLAFEYNTVWMPEYGREYWEKNQIDRRLTPEQLTEIAVGHMEREDKLIQKANKYLFTDTNAITTYLFSMYYHGKADKRLTILAYNAAYRYDRVLLCDTDIPYDDTWDRSGDVQRQEFQQSFIKELFQLGVKFDLISGTLPERVTMVKEILSK